MLRHDPDIMMVGEIRDFETAEMAIRSSLTGHLVFSTLHTNDAVGAVARLMDMNIEPFLIANTLIASIAQRLIRCVCPLCSRDYVPTPEERLLLKGVPDAADQASFQRGTGCEACRGTGYRGRMAIYEILPFTARVKELVAERASSGDILSEATRLGMRTLRNSGWQQACRGKTTFEEVLRVTAEADIAEDAYASV